MNNLKLIRELYGATQEQVATAINVNRVTVANWENNGSTASNSNQEKLSIYYGIGPEYFYKKELDDDARQLIALSSANAKKIAEESEGLRNKEEDFHKTFESFPFKEAMKRYMYATKMLLALADRGEIDKLETALKINEKLGARLESIIAIRREELNNGEPTLKELLESIGND